jgi:hypothetical protein
MSRKADRNRERKWHNRQDKIHRRRQVSTAMMEATAKHFHADGQIVAVALVAAIQKKEKQQDFPADGLTQE